MGRSERWATDREKKKTLSKNGAGPILYLEMMRNLPIPMNLI